MKKTCCYIIAIIALSACSKPCDQNTNAKELDALKVKLDATEAQLLNVSAELSKCKTGSSFKEIITEADSTEAK